MNWDSHRLTPEVIFLWDPCSAVCMCSTKTLSGPQRLRVQTAVAQGRVQFLAPMSGCWQPLVTPAPESLHPLLAPVATAKHMNTATQRHTHTYEQLKIKTNLSKSLPNGQCLLLFEHPPISPECSKLFSICFWKTKFFLHVFIYFLVFWEVFIRHFSKKKKRKKGGWVLSGRGNR